MRLSWSAAILVAFVVSAAGLGYAFRTEITAALRVSPLTADRSPQVTPEPRLRAVFGPCRPAGGPDCVIDGDTFRLDGTTIRVADIDAPEVNNYRCAAEKALGDRSTMRLQALLNAGPFALAQADRDEDQYGRKLRVVMRDGQSLGMTLVAEGLARKWDGARRSWC